MTRDWTSRVRCLASVLALLLSGCATTQYDYPRTESRAIPAGADTRLGARVEQLAPADPALSGFYLLTNGIDALAARLLLAARAERSIDAQYYFVLDDLTGRTYLRELLLAADRGVRVRLLMDDIRTAGFDEALTALDAHPNLEVRIFNPFSRRGGRSMDFVTRFGQANRRMHNKSMTVDGAASIVGGRNIGDEYFAAREDVNFGDLDVLGFGRFAADVGLAFDAYWNHELALPVAALVDTGKSDLQALQRAYRASLDEAVAKAADSQYADALRSNLLAAIQREPDALVWATYRLVYDDPSKADPRASAARGMIDALGSVVDEAQTELLAISPYFVPRRAGIEYFRGLRERGVRTVIVTNGLASTDVPAVHSGYAPSRKPLLEMGAELWEVRPDAQVSGTVEAGVGLSRSSLHTKAFAVDRERLFVGSFNWDPRSARLNTEMGVVIDSPALAGGVADRVEAALPQAAYRVELDDRNRIAWVGQQSGETERYRTEPGTGFWQRFAAGLLGILPIDSQL
jgi:putative cardiolipin synthase